MFRTIFCVLLVGAVIAQQDQTRTPGAHGSEVVEAVINLIKKSCLFPDDKLFLRRLAYVETHDGNDPKTYRAGYDGGIWQIDEDKFNQIKSNSKATALFDGIRTQFAVDWSTVQWSDLRKPLYSGLAAALYMTTITEEVPRRMENQGPYYGKYFRIDPNSAHNYYVAIKGFNNACQRTNLDLAFLVDGSSSLSPDDFTNAKKFASDVVDLFTVGPDDVRVAFVTFSSGYQSVFDFNQYKDKEDLKKAIMAIPKTEGGTDTDQALQYAGDDLFTSSKGSRSGSSKVVLLLTDGLSTDAIKTSHSAAYARSKNIIIYAIGLGKDVNNQELTDVASDPHCTHVIKLAGYSDLSALVSEIQQVSCQAAAILGPGSYTFPCSKGGLFEFITNGSVTQVTISGVTDGTVEIYGSLLNPNPSQAVHSFSSTAQPRTSSIVFIDQEFRPVYVTVQSAAPPNQCKGSFTVEVSNVHRVPANTLVSCVNHDHGYPCSLAIPTGYMYTLLSPPYSFPSPCRAGVPSFQPHPFDETKFLFCDRNGTVYVFQCAPHNIFNPSTLDCVAGEPHTTQAPTPKPTTHAPDSGNPCTEEHKKAGLFFFPYPPDETKYIDCTNWPALGYIKDCYPPGKIWDQLDLTCTWKHVVINPTEGTLDLGIPNPCKNPLRDGDMFYFPHPTNKHQYIHCDAHGDAYLKTCPGNMVWHQRVLQCIPDTLMPGLP